MQRHILRILVAILAFLLSALALFWWVTWVQFNRVLTAVVPNPMPASAANSGFAAAFFFGLTVTCILLLTLLLRREA